MVLLGGNEPRYTQPQMLLIDDETGEDADEHAARREHDDEPEIELLVGPEVLLHDAAPSRPRPG